MEQLLFNIWTRQRKRPNKTKSHTMKKKKEKKMDGLGL